MTDAEQTKKNAVGAVNSQIDRMKKALDRCKDREADIDVRFANSAVGREIGVLRRVVREQRSMIDSFRRADYIGELESALENNRQNEKLKRMRRKRNALVDELDEINKATTKALRDQKEFARLLDGLNVERPVLEDLIRSTYEDNNRNIIKYMNF